MAGPFSRSLRSIESDGHGRALGWIAVAVVLLALWALWFARARVTLRATTGEGRVVVDRAVFGVHAGASGRVVAAPGLVLGARVRAGDALVELDARAERLRLDEERARADGLARERVALERRIEALESARAEGAEADRAARDAAAQSVTQLELAATLAHEEETRLGRLFELGGLSELELSRARNETLRAKSAVEEHRFSLERLEFDQRRLASDRSAELEALRGALVALDGRSATTRVALERIEHEIAEKTLRAPADGELADVAPIGPGTYVESGARVAAVVAAAELEVVARFAPDVALGRLAPGQRARLRFDGFPWSRWGVVHARVASVGRELRDGRIQVELAVDRDAPTEIPLQHGLECAVEVELEDVSPAELVLLSAGKTP